MTRDRITGWVITKGAELTARAFWALGDGLWHAAGVIEDVGMGARNAGHGILGLGIKAEERREGRR